MHTKQLALIIVLSMFLIGGTMSSFAQYTANQQYDVRASIPQQNGFTVTINRVQGTTWSTRSSVDFGSLFFDGVNNIFLSNYYYAVDVGVLANLPNWSIKHTTTPVVNTTIPGETLDSHINVSFVKQLDAATAAPLDKVTYANSNNKVYTKDQLLDGWLRIYYGIATGEPGKDAPGASPIGISTPSGTYLGQVTLTLFQTP